MKTRDGWLTLHLATIEPLEERRAPAALVVTSALDTKDPGKLTLREAIIQSNAMPGFNTITFNIAPMGDQTINLGAPLPAITVPVAIFGGTENNTTYVTPAIILNGSGAGPGDGFDLLAGNSTIEGFVIENFTGNGVFVRSSHNEIINDCIGTNAAHDGAAPNTRDGVFISSAAGTAIQSCIISGNIRHGIEVAGAAAKNTLIGKGPTANANTGTPTGYGNYIGVDYDASGEIPNKQDGVLLWLGSQQTTLNDNIISGNLKNGVEIDHSNSNTLLGNFIGTDRLASTAIANSLDGVLINVSANNTIGGTVYTDTNIISGNTKNGVELIGTATKNTSIVGNFIGTAGATSKAIPNELDGVLINGAPGNNIGAAAANGANVISGNGKNGIHITGKTATGDNILYNNIGTDSTGKTAVGNTEDGIFIEMGAKGTNIGSKAQGFQSVISGNLNDGIEINGKTTSGTTIINSFIGVDSSGATALQNDHNGITLTDVGGATIGGTVQPLGNVISGNAADGIAISGMSSTGIKVYGNKIGTDASGTMDAGNGGDGVFLDQGASGNTIGIPGKSDAINIICANGQNGIEINGDTTSNNTVQNCYVGADASGMAALGNDHDGILIMSAPGNTIGGTNEGTMRLVQGNLVSGNTFDGIEITGGPAAGTHVRGNFIGTNSASNGALPNGGDGLFISGAVGSVVGSGPKETAGDYRNVVSGNGINGVEIADGANNTVLGGNYIGTDISGAQAVGNGADGLLINGSANTVTENLNTVPNALISGNTLNGVEIKGGSDKTTLNFIGIGVNAGATAALANGADGVLIDGSPGAGFLGCIVSGNGANGFHLTNGTSNATVNGCSIGTNGGKTAAIANGKDGILIDGGSNTNTIGGAARQDTIAGNTGSGIEIGGGAAGNIIHYDFIGVAEGAAMANGGDGVLLTGGATANHIGDGASQNVISGNTGAGVHIQGANANFVQGDYIGTDASGKTATPNGIGLLIDGGAANNTIGGVAAAPGTGVGNLVSGNAGVGVKFDGLTTTGNMVQGNLIGTQAGGAVALGNGGDGVLIGGDAFGNFIGLATGGNIISGNSGNGVHIDGLQTKLNDIVNNLIGAGMGGGAAANRGDGVLISGGANGNIIGGPGATLGNVISGNRSNGIEINGSLTDSNTVQNNTIGLAPGGIAKLGNLQNGILAGGGASDNALGLIGGGNLIAANGGNGIEIDDTASTGNTIAANKIGTNTAGAAGFGNALDGVLIHGASNMNVGSSLIGGGNLISGNVLHGVHIENNASGITVENNRIGSNAAGNAALANGGSGVVIDDSNNNVIGGATVPADNLIAFNGVNGIVILSGTGNHLEQNSIFNNGKLGIDLNNDGVTLNTLGGPHTGANLSQNFPVIASASYNGPVAGTSVHLTLNSTPNSSFTVELFDSPAANASGYGEGMIYLGSVVVNTDNNGNGSAMTSLPGASAGGVLTATATDAAGNTSEFSAAATIADGFPLKVDNVLFVKKGASLSGLEVFFNEGVRTASLGANSLQIMAADRAGQFTVPIALSKSHPFTYDPGHNTVTLNPAKALAAGKFYEVTVNGSTSPVTDLAGSPLDGEFSGLFATGDGSPGGDFKAIVGFGTKLKYTDSHNDTVSLNLTGGGAMELIRTLDGEGRFLELLSAVAGKTRLDGAVTAPGGAQGSTTLEGITGAANIADQLTPPQFIVGSATIPA